MRVYRYLCEAELKSLLAGDMSKVGTSRVNNRSNSHHYKQGVKYLHFFKNIDDLQEIRRIKSSSKEDFYVGLFDIPLPTLLFNSGKGYYEGRGYDIDHVTVREYAIPASQIKPEYLIYYMQDPKREVTHEQVSQEITFQDKLGTKSTKPQEIGATLGVQTYTASAATSQPIPQGQETSYSPNSYYNVTASQFVSTQKPIMIQKPCEEKCQ